MATLASTMASLFSYDISLALDLDNKHYLIYSNQWAKLLPPPHTLTYIGENIDLFVLLHYSRNNGSWLYLSCNRNGDGRKSHS